MSGTGGLRYIDVCSGISAPTMAWKPLGWKALCFAEIEPAPRAVLAHHYPDTPLHGDFTQIKGDEYGPVDLLVGGTPCQSFSIAGLRGGMDDSRGNLALEFARLADRTRARWLVWENVPGVLSIDGGRAFGSILGALAELGYGFAYRVLDAQHFGVPQRRRRVFVVGYLGDWRRAAAVLFERNSLQGNPAPRRETGQVAPTIPSRSSAGGGLGTDFDCDGGLIPFASIGNGEYAPGVGSLRAKGADCGGGSETLISATVSSKRAKGSGGPSGDECQNLVCDTLTSNGDAHSGFRDHRGLVPVAIQERAVSENIDAGPQGKGWQEDCAYTLEARNKVQSVAFSGQMSVPSWQFDMAETLQAKNPRAVATGSAVRRLTPRECERLQGFPDDFTLVPFRNRMMADGPRYKMLGNSMAVPVLRWIGERIALVEALSLPAAEQAPGSHLGRGAQHSTHISQPSAQHGAELEV